MITFHVEPLGQVIEQLKPLFPEHWKELALNQDCVPLDPQYDVYARRESEGSVLCVVGRSAGVIVGYFVGFVAPGLHYKTCLTLTMDIFWLSPEHRGASEGFKLFACVESEATRRGVQRIFMGSKLHKDAGWLFERLGYRPVETYYSKMVRP